MLNRILVILATVSTAACVTIVPPPTTIPRSGLPQPVAQEVNMWARRVDVTVINNCAAPLLLVRDNNNRVVAWLAPGDQVLVYMQRSFSGAEPNGTIKAFAYLRNDPSTYFGEAQQTFNYNLGDANSHVFPKETFLVNNVGTMKNDVWMNCRPI